MLSEPVAVKTSQLFLCLFSLFCDILTLNTDFVHNVIYNIEIVNIELSDTSLSYC